MNIHVISVPYQLDVARWAYALGPRAFLDHGLVVRCQAVGHRVASKCKIDFPRDERTRDIVTNLARIAKRTASAVAAALADPDGLALILEGDCSHAVGVIGGLARASYRPGVAWFDAHGDLHTYATTTTGYVGGMPLAVALGWDLADWRLQAGLQCPLRPEATALIGASDLDPEEVEALDKHPIARLDANSLADDPVVGVAELLGKRRAEATAWYLHLDVDVAGPREVPGGLTPSPNPPGREVLRAALRTAAKTLQVRALSLATYNPSSDPEGRGVRFGLDMLEAMLAGISDGPSQSLCRRVE